MRSDPGFQRHLWTQAAVVVRVLPGAFRAVAAAGIVGGLAAWNALAAQSLPLDPESRAALYQPPQALIDGGQIDRLEQELGNLAARNPTPPDARASYLRILGEARAQLDQYYAQFLHEKRTADERADRSLRFGNLNANDLRRLILREDLEYARPNFQGESPYLFRLHRILSRVYGNPAYSDDPADTRRALREAVMALRYTGRPLETLLGQTGTPVPVPDNDASRTGPPAGAADPRASDADARAQIDRERMYMAMLRGFGDPNRIAQASATANPPAETTTARELRSLLEEFVPLKAELAEARRSVFVAEAAAVRGVTGGPTPAEAAANRDRLQARFDQISADLERIRTGAYQQYTNRKRQTEGALALRMARLSFALEQRNKQRLRAENRRSYQRGSGDQAGVDRTAHRDYPGYRMFLQLSHALNPVDLAVLDLLTAEFRSSRRLRPAIAFQEALLERAANRPAGLLTSADEQAVLENLAPQYLRLGGMYADERNRIRAAAAYERYLETTPARGAAEGTPARAEFLQIQRGLADLHFQHTGRLARAAELYRAYLQGRPAVPAANEPDGATPAAVRARARRQTEDFQIYDRLATIERRGQRNTDEARELAAARSAYVDLERQYDAAVTRVRTVQAEILQVKSELLQDSPPERERRYYRLQRMELPAAEEQASFLRSRLRSLPIGGVLERLAFFAHQERRFPKALELYREILRRGNAAAAGRARENIERIHLTLGDGRLRRPRLDPRFER